MSAYASAYPHPPSRSRLRQPSTTSARYPAGRAARAPGGNSGHVGSYHPEVGRRETALMGTRREEHEDAGRRREEVDRAQRAQMQKPDEKENYAYQPYRQSSGFRAPPNSPAIGLPSSYNPTRGSRRPTPAALKLQPTAPPLRANSGGSSNKPYPALNHHIVRSSGSIHRRASRRTASRAAAQHQYEKQPLPQRRSYASARRESDARETASSSPSLLPRPIATRGPFLRPQVTSPHSQHILLQQQQQEEYRRDSYLHGSPSNVLVRPPTLFPAPRLSAHPYPFLSRNQSEYDEKASFPTDYQLSDPPPPTSAAISIAIAHANANKSYGAERMESLLSIEAPSWTEARRSTTYASAGEETDEGGMSSAFEREGEEESGVDEARLLWKELKTKKREISGRGPPRRQQREREMREPNLLGLVGVDQKGEEDRGEFERVEMEGLLLSRDPHYDIHASSSASSSGSSIQLPFLGHPPVHSSSNYHPLSPPACGVRDRAPRPRPDAPCFLPTPPKCDPKAYNDLPPLEPYASLSPALAIARPKALPSTGGQFFHPPRNGIQGLPVAVDTPPISPQTQIVPLEVDNPVDALQHHVVPLPFVGIMAATHHCSFPSSGFRQHNPLPSSPLGLSFSHHHPHQHGDSISPTSTPSSLPVVPAPSPMAKLDSHITRALTAFNSPSLSSPSLSSDPDISSQLERQCSLVSPDWEAEIERLAGRVGADGIGQVWTEGGRDGEGVVEERERRSSVWEESMPVGKREREQSKVGSEADKADVKAKQVVAEGEVQVEVADVRAEEEKEDSELPVLIRAVASSSSEKDDEKKEKDDLIDFKADPSSLGLSRTFSLLRLSPSSRSHSNALPSYSHHPSPFASPRSRARPLYPGADADYSATNPDGDEEEEEEEVVPVPALTFNSPHLGDTNGRSGLLPSISMNPSNSSNSTTSPVPSSNPSSTGTDGNREDDDDDYVQSESSLGLQLDGDSGESPESSLTLTARLSSLPSLSTFAHAAPVPPSPSPSMRSIGGQGTPRLRPLSLVAKYKLAAAYTEDDEDASEYKSSGGGGRERGEGGGLGLMTGLNEMHGEKTTLWREEVEDLLA